MPPPHTLAFARSQNDGLGRGAARGRVTGFLRSDSHVFAFKRLRQASTRLSQVQSPRLQTLLPKLARLDLNQDSQDQNLVCYRYTTGYSRH